MGGKQGARDLIKGELTTLSAETRDQLSIQLESNLLSWLSSFDQSTHPLAVVGLFLPHFRSEPRWNFARWAKFPWRLGFPGTKKSDPGYHLPTGPLPQGTPWLGGEGELVQPDVIIVPGLAFSEEGWRLGRGGGWYDRYLEDQRPRYGCVGVCFESQVRGGWEPEAHDRKMNVLVTESRVRHCPR